MPQQVYLTNIQKFSTHDGPGIRTNIFLKGCPMHCKWCANPETIEPFPQLMFHRNKCTGCGRCTSICPNGAIERDGDSIRQISSRCRNCGRCVDVCMAEAREVIGMNRTPEQVAEEISKDEVFYFQDELGGVTFSGGEPLIHPDYLYPIARTCKEKGYSVAVETCGFFDYERIERLLPLIDLFLFDLKILDDEKHRKYCGQSNARILSNFERVIQWCRVTPRIPIIPGINDGVQDIVMLCRFLDRFRDKIDMVHILPYHNLAMGKYEALDVTYELTDIKPPSDSHMEQIKKAINSRGFEVTIGG